MPRTGWGWQVSPDELRSWILHEDERLLVVNKPGLVVCHPSKHGPWSSLIGACREYLGVERLHMPSRLDRETSGVVVLAKDAQAGSLLQRAIEHRKIRKVYHAVLCGELHHAATVDAPIAKALDSTVWMKQAVVDGGQPARTGFTPLSTSDGFTLARIQPHTGRMHQIRVHAASIGHPVAGDKIYGPDEQLFLEFLQHGWTPHLQAVLRFDRQMLHASEWESMEERLPLRFHAPLPAEWQSVTCVAAAPPVPQQLA
ncbi:MAG: RluA family pseudouridine synthase [Bryobacterales bacterium]|nr:RluA family pseudouridine synthase [Bryobacterales bacterium]